MVTFTITPRGAFSLRESAEFGFGQRHSERFDGCLRLAFCLDGYRDQVGVELRQDGRGVHGVAHGAVGDLQAVKTQVARVLSLDYDATGYEAIGGRDPVIGRLLDAAPGLRPPLFYSAYEAAVWSVLSARRPAKQMADLRRRLSEAHGRTFELAGRPLAALPTPEQMLAVQEFPGLPGEKLTRMHGVAEAALRGQLDTDRLQRLGPEAAADDLQRLKGIGPFYASLITIRAMGFTDILPVDEPILRGLVMDLYRLPAPCSTQEFTDIAEPWRPFRTWASVLVRAASGRLREDDPVPKSGADSSKLGGHR